jgi:hypothetical protein
VDRTWKSQQPTVTGGNSSDSAIDVYQDKDVEGQNVILHTKNNGLNQKWKIVYVKGAPKAPTEG